MSNFDLLYKTKNYNINNFDKSLNSSNKSINYFENDIKNGLNFFNQNKLQSTLKNNFFNGNDDNKMTTSEKMDKINIEAKKIIEREMSPYLTVIKKELNLIIEKFSKDLEKKNEEYNELFKLKEDINIIKKTQEDIQNNFQQKIIETFDNLNELKEKVEKNDIDMKKFNQLFSFQIENGAQIPNITNDIYKIKQELKLQEKNIQNLLLEQKNNTEITITQKFKECENKIKNIKEDNEVNTNKLEEFNNILRIIKMENKEKNEEMINKSNSNEDMKNIIKEMQLSISDKEYKIKNLEDFNENFKINLENINKKIETAFNNINTEHLSIIQVAQNLKIFNNNSKSLEELIENNIYKKEYMDAKFDTINDEINFQNEKMKEMNIKLNENINEKNNKLILDVNKRLLEYKNNIENNYDEIEGNIQSINNKINEFTTIIQTHPILNMNNNEIINLKFKENQMKFNEIFKNAINEIKGEIKKSEKDKELNKLNFQSNLNKINEEITQ